MRTNQANRKSNPSTQRFLIVLVLVAAMPLAMAQTGGRPTRGASKSGTTATSGHTSQKGGRKGHHAGRRKGHRGRKKVLAGGTSRRGHGKHPEEGETKEEGAK